MFAFIRVEGRFRGIELRNNRMQRLHWLEMQADVTGEGTDNPVDGTRTRRASTLTEDIRPYAFCHTGHTRVDARGILGVARAY